MFARTAALALSMLTLVACADHASSPDAASNDQAATSSEPACGASYAVADAHYKKAVAIAKQRKVDACMGPDGSDESSDLMSLASELAAATSACSAFANIVKTSEWAAPIREEMKGNLALAALTGELQVKDASGDVVFQGLDAALASGVTLWGPAPGAFGNKSKIEFGADGQALVWELGYHGGSHIMYWKDTAATYRIGNVDGDAVLITITTADGTSIDYELRARTILENVPDFELAPIGADTDTFTAYVSECEA